MANIGLIEAIYKFDLSKTNGRNGVAFLAGGIVLSISHAVREGGYLVRIPSDMQSKLNYLKKARATLEHQNNRPPSREEVVEEIKKDTKHFKTLQTIQNTLDAEKLIMDSHESIWPEKLWDPASEDPLERLINDESQALIREELFAEPSKSVLKDHEREILKLHFGFDSTETDPLSYNDIAKKLGFCRETIIYKTAKACTTLKYKLNSKIGKD